MSLLTLILVVLAITFLFGGGWAYNQPTYQGYGYGGLGVGTLLFIVFLVLMLR